jgi:UDP-N-acetylmuramate dehydrogenase
MNWQKLAQELKTKIKGQVLAEAPLKNYTTWRVGGPADLICIPAEKTDVQLALAFAREYNLPVTVIGNGSNLLVLDGGIRGLVLSICGGLNFSNIHGDLLVSGGGVLLPALARQACCASLSGLEFAAGIPATLGGAIIMNAGAFGQNTGSLIEEVQTIQMDGIEKKWRGTELSFGYRHSSLKGKGLIVLQAVLKLTPAIQDEISVRMKKNLASRKRTQPLEFPTAGSVFRNPPGDYAGRLIEAVGLKGFCLGDAQVSSKHANFIINRGNATGQEIKLLIEMIQKCVYLEKGIALVPEVMIVGEEG